MKIKCLMVYPGMEVKTVKVPANIKFIKSLIGKELYKVKLSENVILIANKNANIDEFNRILGRNIILGAFLVVATKKNKRISMKKREITKYKNMFKLRKHQKKIEFYKEEFLEDYYTIQKQRKQEITEKNKKEIFNLNIAA